MALASDLLTMVQGTFPDFDPTAAASLAWLQEAHNLILAKVRLKPLVNVTLTLVADQSEYALSDSIARIWNATYYEDVNSPVRLIETSYDKLDYDYPTWQEDSSSTPYQYYDLANVVGLYPAPATATSGSYPSVLMRTTQKETLTTGSTMPANVPNYDAWTDYVRAKFCKDFYPAQMESWMQLHRIALESLASYIYGRQPRNKPKAEFNLPRVTNV